MELMLCHFLNFMSGWKAQHQVSQGCAGKQPVQIWEAPFDNLGISSRKGNESLLPLSRLLAASQHPLDYSSSHFSAGSKKLRIGLLVSFMVECILSQPSTSSPSPTLFLVHHASSSYKMSLLLWGSEVEPYRLQLMCLIIWSDCYGVHWKHWFMNEIYEHDFNLTWLISECGLSPS